MSQIEKLRRLESELRDLKQELAETNKHRDELRDQLREMKTEVAWHAEYAQQAQIFLLAVTNTAVLSGRGWLETKRRLDASKPKTASASYALVK